MPASARLRAAGQPMPVHGVVCIISVISLGLFVSFNLNLSRRACTRLRLTPVYVPGIPAMLLHILFGIVIVYLALRYCFSFDSCAKSSPANP